MPTFRSSWLKSSVAPIGASGWVRLGIRPSRRFSSTSISLSFSLTLDGLGLEPLPLGDQFAPLMGILLLAGGLGDLVLAPTGLLDSLDQGPPGFFQGDHAVDLVQDVGGDIPVAAVLLDGLGVGGDVFQVEHAKTFAADRAWRGDSDRGEE